MAVKLSIWLLLVVAVAAKAKVQEVAMGPVVVALVAFCLARHLFLLAPIRSQLEVEVRVAHLNHPKARMEATAYLTQLLLLVVAVAGLTIRTALGSM
jgi:hypothetical protein